MKLKKAVFNRETGESEVVLADRFGIYRGKAKLHPDDKENASEFAGCRIAEYRAWINLLKAQYRRIKIKLNTIISLQKDLINNECFPDTVKERFYFKIRDYRKELKDIDNSINLLNNTIRENIKIRDEIIKRKKEQG